MKTATVLSIFAAAAGCGEPPVSDPMPEEFVQSVFEEALAVTRKHLDVWQTPSATSRGGVQRTDFEFDAAARDLAAMLEPNMLAPVTVDWSADFVKDDLFTLFSTLTAILNFKQEVEYTVVDVEGYNDLYGAVVRVRAGQGQLFETDERVLVGETNDGWRLVKLLPHPIPSYYMTFDGSDGRWHLDTSHTRPAQAASD